MVPGRGDADDPAVRAVDAHGEHGEAGDGAFHGAYGVGAVHLHGDGAAGLRGGGQPDDVLDVLPG